MMQTLLHGAAGADAATLWALFTHFLMLSMLAIGGAIVTVPDMHRYLVGKQGWLSDADFTSGIAIAQAAPGPNVLFVAVLGFQVAGLWGALAGLLGSLLPSTVFALSAAKFGEQHRSSRGVRAFTQGLAPITLGLLAATAWVLTEPARGAEPTWSLLVLSGAVALGGALSKRNPLWWVASGAGLGALGWL